MGTIQIKRGLSTNLPTSAAIGEILYTTDTKRFYIGNGAEIALTEFGNFEELLQAINNKADSVHTHTSSDITNFNTSVDARIILQKGIANGIATLDENGVIPTSQIPSIFKEAEVVQNIAERNSLTTFAGLHAFVLNASDDATVEKGGAEYIYDGSKWVKLSELNDLDTVITWENITNRPNLVKNLLELSDTPSSYENQAGKILIVKSDASGLEFSSTFKGNIDGGSF